MSGLQKKLSLGFGGLLLIIVIIGIQGILHLTRLGESIDVILRENYRSVVACQEMKEALERIDSGILFVLLGDGDKGIELIRRNLVSFEKALKVESNNVTMPGEGEKAALIEELYGQFKAHLTGIDDARKALALQRETYFSEILPLFYRIKGTADEVLRMNQENMNEANDKARHNAASARRQMYVLLLVGTIVAVGFFFFTSRWFLRPINRLIKSADEIGKGNLDLVVQSNSRDEIGHLSEAFNAMATNLREFRRSDRAKIFRIQRSTQQAFDRLPDALAVLDSEGRVEVATELARDAFDMKVNTSIQDFQVSLIANICQRALDTGRRAVADNGKTVIQQFVKGEERFFQPEATPILDHEGETTGVVLVLKDVTQSWQQDEIKRGIISTVSHQLKTPLTSVRMAVHLLLDEKVGPLTEKQVELLLAAREDSDRLHNILNSLLDINRMESGKAAMHLTAVNPTTFTLDAVDHFTLAARDKGVAIRAELHEDLPEVWADVTQIGHVFSNLLTNALRYTNPGGEITISARADDAVVIFEVTDSGRGIPPEYLNNVFEKFFRVPDQGKETGAGLGLAIVKEIVEAHGGTAGVKSTEGRGSTFTFTLRRADRTMEEETRS